MTYFNQQQCNVLPQLKTLLDGIWEAWVNGSGDSDLPDNAAANMATWIDALDYHLTEFSSGHVPTAQRAANIEKLVHGEKPEWLVYMSDGGYTRIMINLCADGAKIWAAELTARSRPRWDEWNATTDRKAT